MEGLFLPLPSYATAATSSHLIILEALYPQFPFLSFLFPFHFKNLWFSDSKSLLFLTWLEPL